MGGEALSKVLATKTLRRWQTLIEITHFCYPIRPTYIKTTLEWLLSRQRNQAHDTGVKIIDVVSGDLDHESGGPVTFHIRDELDRILCLGHSHSFVHCRVEKHLLGTRARVSNGIADRSLVPGRCD